MNSIFYTIGMALLWAVNLLNGTGLGAAYRTTEYAQIVVLVVAMFCIMKRNRTEGGLFMEKRYFNTLVPMAVLFVLVSLLNGQRYLSLEYLWVFLVVYILSTAKPTVNALRLTGICYGVLGLAILWIYNYTDALKGWNPNTIAMTGFFSFLVFTIPFYGMREWRSVLMLPAVGAAYAFLIWPTDSRSCILAIVIALILVLGLIPARKMITSTAGVFLILLVPLFTAVIVCTISALGNVTWLGEWSEETFGKSLFNGRDTAWMQGFQQLMQTPFFGNGYIDSGVYHNSAVACLAAYGVVGYYLWIRLFHTILMDGRNFVGDTCVAGGIVAFLVLFCQQAVELGIFAQNPNLIPYVILGIILGRVNYLRSGRQWNLAK